MRKCNAVCFDVDSTVIRDEGIDVLAEFNGAGDAVSAWTKKYTFFNNISIKIAI